MSLTGIHLRAPLQLVTPWTQTWSLILILTNILNSTFREAHVSAHTAGLPHPWVLTLTLCWAFRLLPAEAWYPSPIDWEHLSHTRRLCLPPRRKHDTWNSKNSEQEKSAYAHLRPPPHPADAWTSADAMTLTLTHALNSASWGAQLKASRLGQLCP